MNHESIGELLRDIRRRLISLDAALDCVHADIFLEGKNSLRELRRIAELAEAVLFSESESLQAMAERLKFERRWNEFLFFVLHVLYKGRELEDPYRLEKLYRDGKLPPGAKEVDGDEEKSGGGVGEGTCGT